MLCSTPTSAPPSYLRQSMSRTLGALIAGACISRQHSADAAAAAHVRSAFCALAFCRHPAVPGFHLAPHGLWLCARVRVSVRVCACACVCACVNVAFTPPFVPPPAVHRMSGGLCLRTRPFTSGSATPSTTMNSGACNHHPHVCVCVCGRVRVCACVHVFA